MVSYALLSGLLVAIAVGSPDLESEEEQTGKTESSDLQTNSKDNDVDYSE